MKKIMTKSELAKKKNRMKMLVGGTLIFLMFFSTIAFVFTFAGFGGGLPGTEDYYFDGQYWVLQSGGQVFYFNNHRDEVRDVPIEMQSTLLDFSGRPLYIDSERDEITILVSTNLARYALRTQEACYGECEGDLPRVGCDENLIVWMAGEEESVRQEDKCIFIEGNRAADAFLYRVLGNL
jgi:hypothetical protein